MADDAVASALKMFGEAAKAIGLKGKELEKYVHEHMIRAGFSAKTSTTYSPGKARSSEGGSFLGSLFGNSGNTDDDDE